MRNNIFVCNQCKFQMIVSSMDDYSEVEKMFVKVDKDVYLCQACFAERKRRQPKKI